MTSDVVPELVVTVPIRVLGLNDLVQKVAVTVLDGVSVIFAPNGIFLLETLFFPEHALKLLVKFRSVAVAVQEFSQDV